MTLRRGDPNAYKPRHPHIGSALGAWQGLCGRCGKQVNGSTAKKHAMWGLVCKDGCKRGD